MKTNKLMLAAMLLGALAMVSCKKTGNDPEKQDKKDTTSVVVPDLEEEPIIVHYVRKKDSHFRYYWFW